MARRYFRSLACRTQLSLEKRRRWRLNGKTEGAIQFPLDCELIPRSKLITTGTAEFCSSSCASCLRASKRHSQEYGSGALESARGTPHHDGNGKPRDQRARCPLTPPPAWLCYNSGCTRYRTAILSGSGIGVRSARSVAVIQSDHASSSLRGFARSLSLIN